MLATADRVEQEAERECEVALRDPERKPGRCTGKVPLEPHLLYEHGIVPAEAPELEPGLPVPLLVGGVAAH